MKYWRNYNVGDGHMLSINPVKLKSTLNIFADFKVPCKETNHFSYPRNTNLRVNSV